MPVKTEKRKWLRSIELLSRGLQERSWVGIALSAKSIVAAVTSYVKAVKLTTARIDGAPQVALGGCRKPKEVVGIALWPNG